MIHRYELCVPSYLGISYLNLSKRVNTKQYENGQVIIIKKKLCIQIMECTCNQNKTS